MTITIYHGSSCIVKHPVLNKSKAYNDFGSGFYCTKLPDLAKEWAVKKNVDGYSNKYALGLDTLQVLDLSSKNFSILHWLTVLLQNRSFTLKSEVSKQGKSFLISNYQLPLEDYDIIKGYRGDDSNFFFAESFVNNEITFRQFSDSVRLGRLGEQICLRSEKAISLLTFLGCENAPASTSYINRLNRNDQARLEFLSPRFHEIDSNDIFLSDLIRGSVSCNDSRLQ